MDQRSVNRRRQARAIAISEAVDVGRKAAVTRALMALTAMAVAMEAAMMAHSVWGLSHP